MNQKQAQALQAFEGALAGVLGIGSIHHTLAQRELEKLKAAFASESVAPVVEKQKKEAP